ncbi:hypothetical protein [uncultured Roseobacter sp.]|uniref:hypothetical protein n=1 Tax=uncultured Roseobacter sp. TaxID=114847 RepID=UPI00262EB990|nr:hypothetical protein [uncultured Roseobacter sp.]
MPKASLYKPPAQCRRRRFVAAVAMALVLPSASPAQDWQPASSRTDWSAPGAMITSFALSGSEGSAKPSRAKPVRAALPPGPEMDRLLSLIALAEVREGYDSVNLRARIKPPGRPSTLTLGQIFDWIDATPGQQHAIGRYQKIPKTLGRLVRIAGLERDTRFDAATQDMLARILVSEAGWTQFKKNQISRETFMDNLAKIWAGLPLASGRSAYHGFAGNKATITRAEYAAHMEEIFG